MRDTMINRQLFITLLKNVIPSVIGFALSGIYTIVDGFFVGHSMGDIGLAAVTVGFPISAFIQAIGTGIGIAGGIQYSISLAKNNKKQSLEYFTATTVIMVILSIILTGVFYFFASPILFTLGATGTILDMAVEYVTVIALGTACQLLATGIIPFVRNMNGAKFAMGTMILGFSTNIVLDYLLVWVIPMGMFGAALATVIGQLASLLALIFFIVKHNYKLVKLTELNIFKVAKQLFSSALSPFGLSFSSQLTLLFMNKFLFMYGSGQEVAVYGCIDYILSIVYFLIQGVGDGSQPLISFYYGKKDKEKEAFISKMAYYAAFIITIAFAVIVYLRIDRIGFLFGASAETNAEVIKYLPWFLITLLLLCFSRISTTYFYATEKNGLSYILVYGETIWAVVLLIILPKFLKLTGVWLAIPLSQVIIFIIAVVMRSVERIKANTNK